MSAEERPEQGDGSRVSRAPSPIKVQSSLSQTARELRDILDRKTRRDVVLSAAFALVLALVEAAAFALLYPLLQAMSGRAAMRQGLSGRLWELLGRPEYNTFLLVVGTTVVTLLLLRCILGVLLLKVQTAIVTNSEATMTSRLFRNYMSVPYLEHIRRNSAELVRNVNSSVSEVHANMVLPALTILSDVLSIAIIVLVVVVISPLTAVVAVTYFSAVSFIFARLISPRARRVGRRSQDLVRSMFKHTQEGLSGHKLFTVFGQSERVSRDFAAERDKLANARARVLLYSQVPQQYLEGALLIGVLLTAAAAFATQPRASAVATIGLMVGTSFRMLPSLYRTLSGLNRFRIGEAALADIAPDVRAADDAASRQRAVRSAGIALPHLRSAITFDHVSFSYPASRNAALTSVDCSIAKGESVGLVGPSGAGKTTFLDLLMGVLAPTGGRILLDGRPLDQETREAWLALVGYVPQETFLFDGTVRENITFGRAAGESSDAMLERAVALARVTEFLATLPLGLETLVGEHGVRLSGGQRQRIGIARALYGDPEVLVFDEATSSLDGVTEAAITQTLRDLHGTLTVLIVAHRLSTVAHCDRLLLFEAGCLRNTGSFRDLQRDDRLFADLVAHGSLK